MTKKVEGFLFATAISCSTLGAVIVLLAGCSPSSDRFDPPEPRAPRRTMSAPAPKPLEPKADMQCRSNACLELCAEDNLGSPSRPKWCEGFRTPPKRQSVFDPPSE